jgi:L-lactate dehydrogenase (cytochrome)
MTGKALDGAEVAKHDNKKSCWIVLDSKVYDVTDFLTQHPGGAAVLLKQGGTVRTSSSLLVRCDCVLHPQLPACLGVLLKKEANLSGAK